MKMKLNKVFWLLSFLFVVMFAGNAFAVLVELPDSSFQGGKWGGHTTYEKGGFKTLLGFNVYDTKEGNEWVNAGYQMPEGNKRYIYAYRIWNATSDTETEDIGFFKLFTKSGDPLTGDKDEISGIDSIDDSGKAGIKPFGGKFDTANKKIVWEFIHFGTDYEVIAHGEHSYFLFFGSNYTPVAGDFTIESPSETPLPIPEPATIVLLGTGGLILLRKLRKQV